MKLTQALVEGLDGHAQYKTSVPFSGFYNSIHESFFDDEVVHSCENFDEENGHDAVEDSDYTLDFRGYMKAYAEKYCSDFGEYLFLNWCNDFEIDLTFETLTSPREYNFETDRIFAQISGGHVAALFSAIDYDVFSEYLKENFTNRDGFTSFYRPHISIWLAKPLCNWDANEIGALLGCALGGLEDLHVENAREIAYEFISFNGGVV